MTDEQFLSMFAGADIEQGLKAKVEKDGWWTDSVRLKDSEGHLVISYSWDDGSTLTVTY